MTHIFISYKREEQHKAGELAKALAQSGWKVWWDPALVAGERFDDVIGAALEECRCAIVLWSALAVKSSYIRDEASFALERGKLVPLRLDKTELPFRFRGLHTLDFCGWDGTTQHSAFRELADDLRSKVGEPGEPYQLAEAATALVQPPPWWRRKAIAAAAGAVVLAAGLALWKLNPAGNGTNADGLPAACFLAVSVEPVGHQDGVLVLARIAGGATKNFAGSTIEIEPSQLDSWQIEVVWDSAREPSTTPQLNGCGNFASVMSSDEAARISISIAE